MKYIFVSDVHLAASYDNTVNKQTEDKFLRLLNYAASEKAELFLLGDIFDFWFEYKNAIPEGYSTVLARLKQLCSEGMKIHFFGGNHDMWLRDYLSREVGLILHSYTEIMELEGIKYAIGHGHDLGFASSITTRLMWWVFSSRRIFKLSCALIPARVMHRFGFAWSRSSRKSKTVSRPFVADEEFIVKYILSDKNKFKEAQTYIFGHFHCPTHYHFPDSNKELIILGEWTIPNPIYAELENASITLKELK